MRKIVQCRTHTLAHKQRRNIMVPVDHMVNSVPCKEQNEKFEQVLGKYHKDRKTKLLSKSY